ncbi:MAG: diguanylate cyclase [Anaerotardibacter sp.]
MTIFIPIKDLRLKAGLTQAQLAERCKVSSQTVAKWELGQSLPDLKSVVLLAQIFDVSLDELLSRNCSSIENDSPVESNGSFDQRDNSSSDNNCSASQANSHSTKQGITCSTTQNNTKPALNNAENERILNHALEHALAEDSPEKVIDTFIAHMGDMIDCDRIYIFERLEDGSYRNSYEWCKPGIEPQKEHLQNIPPDAISPWVKVFSSGERIFYEDIENIATTDPVVYSWLKPQGIESLIAYPLYWGRCFFGVDNPAKAFFAQTSALMEIMIHFIEIMIRRRDLLQELKLAKLQNDHLLSLVDSVNYQLNIQTGELRFNEDQAKRVGYSYNLNNIKQLHEFIKLHPEFRDRLIKDGVKRAKKERKNVDLQFLSFRKDGKLRWNRLLIRPFCDADGRVLHLYGAIQDWSSKHQIITQYNDYSPNLSGGIHICYLSDPIHLYYASDSLCEFLGYSHNEFDQVVGTKYSNFIFEEDRPKFSQFVRRMAKAPRIESCEYRLVRKDGSIVEVVDTMESIDDGSGTIYGYSYIMEKSELKIALDLARKDARAQLKLIDCQRDALAMLSGDYLNVFRVWLNEDKAQIICLDGYITEGMNRFSSEYIPYYSFCKQYINNRVYHEDQQMMLEAMHPDTVKKAFSEDGEYIVVYRALVEGEPRFYQLKYARLSGGESKESIRFIAGFKNIDKEITEMKRLTDMAQKDALTNLLNTRAYQEFADEIRDRISMGTAGPFGVVVCDINNLKETNDLLGHQEGDEVIRKAAKTICDIFSHSPVYRVGGDEFVAFLQGRDYDFRNDLVEKLRLISRENRITGEVVIACGLSDYMEGDVSLEAVQARADADMYRDKRLLKEF